MSHIFFNFTLKMKRQTTYKKSLYNQKIHSLFTQLICETESLYEKVTNGIPQNPQTIELTTNN
ncbi:hypothetical protein H1P_800018 [Hyella patelloides LEGE 07179]|uniref:Uncharacterized protein n=2 Tax=Hyella TaxID=945733 RepID=A0A563W4F5_9CYAN|nr:hypothetical protein H1P_800018 [Hyella patelloides LEGE 07179]